MKQNYPDWIREFEDTSLDSLKSLRWVLSKIWFYLRHKNVYFSDLGPQEWLLKEAESYDIVIASGRFIISALMFRTPVVFKPVGGDLSHLPFISDSFKDGFISYLYRSRIHKVSRIIIEQEDCIWATHFLGVKYKVRSIAFPVDIHQIRNTVNTKLYNHLVDKYREYDWLIIDPSRKNLNSRHVDYKGNDQAIKAIGKWYEKNPDKKVKIIAGMHGASVDEYRSLVKQLGLEQICDFVDHLSLPDLHAYLSLPNVIVLDQFGSVGTYNLGEFAGKPLHLERL